MHTPGSFAIADPDRREALAYVSDTLASDRAHFRLAVLESLVLALASQFDRVPVHAAAVARNGSALLLAARSGVGKSTLAYAAHAAGLAVMSDDTVWVQRSPRPHVWGMPRRIHLTPGSERFFPELAGAATSVLSNGKVKMAVDLEQRHSGETPLVVDRVGICLVERTSGTLSLSRAEPDDVVRELATHLESGFSLFADQTAAYVRALVGSSAWRLRLAGHPAHAVRLLDAMLDELSPRAPETEERR
jgi:serine kinase of HPr protein (carbohydrate metabolism regulator)